MPQVARHLEFLSEYDLDVVYRPGSQHVNADFVSRVPPCDRGPGKEPCAQCTKRVLGHKSNRNEIGSVDALMQLNAIGRSAVVNSDDASRQVYVTRSSRPSVGPRYDPNFDYGRAGGQSDVARKAKHRWKADSNSGNQGKIVLQKGGGSTAHANPTPCENNQTNFGSGVVVRHREGEDVRHSPTGLAVEVHRKLKLKLKFN
jgi:hypothetical protein